LSWRWILQEMEPFHEQWQRLCTSEEVPRTFRSKVLSKCLVYFFELGQLALSGAGEKEYRSLPFSRFTVS